MSRGFGVVIKEKLYFKGVKERKIFVYCNDLKIVLAYIVYVNSRR